MRNTLLSLAAALAISSTMPVSAQGVIATGDGEDPGHKVEITELKRTSSALTLRFRIINESEKKLDFGYSFSSANNHLGTISGTHLLDNANKKKYLVMHDEKQQCVCSRGLKDLEPNKSVAVWARFPPPPENVEKVTVVVPHFLPIDDVPISK
jgi:hypothetical protein